MNNQPTTEQMPPRLRSFLCSAFAVAKTILFSYERSVEQIYELTQDMKPEDRTRLFAEIWPGRKYY
jgi:hypothetical protein